MDDTTFMQWWRLKFGTSVQSLGPVGLREIELSFDVRHVRLLLYLLGCGSYARNIVEIGVADGTSTIPLLMVARENGGRLISCDPASMDALRLTFEFVERCGLAPYWTFFNGTSDALFERLGESARVDLAFVDGDHGYDAVCRDLRNVLQRLAACGFCVAHDWSAYAEVEVPEQVWAQDPGSFGTHRALHRVLAEFPNVSALPITWLRNDHANDVWAEPGCIVLTRQAAAYGRPSLVGQVDDGRSLVREPVFDLATSAVHMGTKVVYL